MIRLPRAVAVAAGAIALVACSAQSALAQYGRPMMSEPAIGEKYHVETIINFWNPNLDAVISSESLGIVGSEIDVKADIQNKLQQYLHPVRGGLDGRGWKVGQSVFTRMPYRPHSIAMAFVKPSTACFVAQ